MRVKIFATTMNTTNNPFQRSDQVSYETNNTPNFEDYYYYYAQQANADCCIINFICFSCMLIGLYVLFSYNPNANLNVNSFSNKSNLTDIFDPFYKSNISSVPIVKY